MSQDATTFVAVVQKILEMTHNPAEFTLPRRYLDNLVMWTVKCFALYSLKNISTLKEYRCLESNHDYGPNEGNGFFVINLICCRLLRG